MFRHVQGDKMVVLRTELPAVAAAAGRRLPRQPVQPVRGLALCTTRIDAAATCWVQQVICSAAFAWSFSAPCSCLVPGRGSCQKPCCSNHWQSLR